MPFEPEDGGALSLPSILSLSEMICTTYGQPVPHLIIMLPMKQSASRMTVASRRWDMAIAKTRGILASPRCRSRPYPLCAIILAGSGCSARMLSFFNSWSHVRSSNFLKTKCSANRDMRGRIPTLQILRSTTKLRPPVTNINGAMASRSTHEERTAAERREPGMHRVTLHKIEQVSETVRLLQLRLPPANKEMKAC